MTAASAEEAPEREWERGPPTLDSKPAHRHGDARRSWSEPFLQYAYVIVDDPAYAGLPCTTDDQGKVDWTIPSNRSPGGKNWDGNDRRRKWWAERAADLGIPSERKWISRVAKTIHPWGWKPCQPCGRWMRITYSYPRAKTVERLNAHLRPADQLEFTEFLDVYEVVDHLCQALDVERAAAALVHVFTGLRLAPGGDADQIKEAIGSQFVAAESRKLSPGAMCNPPDRLDGFHTYNLCCRTKEDEGRTRENLKTYGVDRRAFEHWSDGDWNAANLLMTSVGFGPCPAPHCGAEVQLTADHSGPISLGFSHTPHFVAVCGPCNSAKGNRMSAADVDRLRELEAQGVTVVSWQAAEIWSRLKSRVDSDDGPLRLSKLMNVNQHQFMRLLLRARSVAPDALLQFLSPQFAEQRVEFIGLDPQTLRYDDIRRTPRQSTYALSKAVRLVRIAFESLEEYSRKENRNVQTIPPDLLKAADTQVDAAILRAQQDPSAWRAPLVDALGRDAAGCERRLRELLGPGSYAPQHDFAYLRDAFAAYMSATGKVLADRFDDRRAIKLWADELAAADEV
jgi:Alw26I/Eco31I/Esp3I family type II restriction endonuclease